MRSEVPPKARVRPACPPKPALRARPLLSAGEAGRVITLFKVLASETRLRLIHALVRAEELSVSDLGRTVGMTPQAVSNQLQRLVDRGVLEARRNGNSVHYRIADPCVPALLDQGLCLAEDSLSEPTGPLDRSAQRPPRRLPERAGRKPR